MKNTKKNEGEIEGTIERLVDFISDSDNKELLINTLVEEYEKKEEEKIDREISHREHKKISDENKIGPHHRPGNISSLLSSSFNMHESENMIARSITATKKSLDKSVESRVDSINRLLSGIGGFSSQLKSCFAKSTVVYFEKDDPEFPYRERLIFSIHLPHYELKDIGGEECDSDSKTEMQMTWDDAVNGLAKIVESAGLKAKYCKNDKNYGQYTMKQELLDGTTIPDEYYSLVLDYMTNEKLVETAKAYIKVVQNYDVRLKKLEKKLDRYSSDSESNRYYQLRKKYSVIKQEKDFFVGTVPDPSQIGEGLLLYIDMSSLKDYHLVRDKMQMVMTRFVLHLSSVDSKMIEYDPDLEYDMWKIKKNEIDIPNNGEEYVRDLDDERVYIVEEKALKPVKNTKNHKRRKAS